MTAVDTMILPAVEAVETDSPPSEEQRRKIHGIRTDDLLAFAGAGAAGTALMLLLTQVVLPIDAFVVQLLVGYACFVVSLVVITLLDEPFEVVKDRVATVVVWTLGSALFAALGFVVAYVLERGRSVMFRPNFLVQDMANAGPLQGLEVGGILHALVGTLQQISIALVITVPLGLLCAVFLTEFPGPLSRFVRTIVEAMTALPSIVAGLFIYATLILGITIPGTGLTLRIDKSGLAAALALSVMMLPIIIRAADVVIRLVPANLREASYALGTGRWATVWNVVLPSARSGLTTAVILGTARGIGETSPVLLTAGFTPTMNANPTSGPQLSLPLAVFSFVQSPQQTMIERGFGTAAALMTVVLILFLLARMLGGRTAGQESKRQIRKRNAASKSDARRFAARLGAGAAVVALAVGAVVVQPPSPASAATFVPVSGAGSTWSQNALDQWIRNISSKGIKINYQGTGSSDGRNQFRNGTVDFAVSEIPYGIKDSGVVDLPPPRGFAYMPIVAGGTSFMYNLKIGGKRVTNLRLSGDTLAKIFTGNISKWNDPAIAADNPSLVLPDRAVIPVVRSDGSGTTAQFTTWLAKTSPQVWDNYCQSAGRTPPCGTTSFFPVQSGSPYVAQAGSLGVSGFVAQTKNEGTITYVEYSYALNTGFPVAKILNQAGYYVEPTAANVAVGLLGAKINTTPGDTYLTQILDGVYANPDKRAYPLSSYSYMILPTKVEKAFTTDKGYTLGEFAKYFLCDGQSQAEKLGYSPLPKNLVEAGLDQVKQIPGVSAATVNIAQCANPTFASDGTNLLAKNAPYPPDCDKKGVTNCSAPTGGAKTRTPGNAKGGKSTGGGSAGADTSGESGGPDTGVAAPDSSAVDPETGQVLGAGTTVTAGGEAVAATSVALNSGPSGQTPLLIGLAGFAVLLATLVPPMLGQRFGRKS